MRQRWAYDFESDKPIRDILSSLNQAGPWKWMERDKDALGTYISSVPFEGARVRIYSDPQGYGEDGPKYTADFRLEESCEVSRPFVEAAFSAMLVTLSARNVTEGECWD
jgi:hypothetical protein